MFSIRGQSCHNGKRVCLSCLLGPQLDVPRHRSGHVLVKVVEDPDKSEEVLFMDNPIGLSDNIRT